MSKNHAVFAEISVESLRDRVVASLKDAFFSGHLKPGDMIVERQLAREMNIGTPAIREALIKPVKPADSSTPPRTHPG